METEHNPYQPPRTREFAKQDSSQELAARSMRLAAATIDGLLIAAILLPMQWMAGVFEGFPRIQEQGPVAILMWSAGGLAVTLLLNGYMLATRAQSIGKAALGIKIVTEGGENADLERIVLRRILPTLLVGLIPILGVFLRLIDVLLIFRKDRRCLHDFIAGTRIVVV